MSDPRVATSFAAGRARPAGTAARSTSKRATLHDITEFVVAAGDVSGAAATVYVTTAAGGPAGGVVLRLTADAALQMALGLLRQLPLQYLAADDALEGLARAVAAEGERAARGIRDALAQRAAGADTVVLK